MKELFQIKVLLFEPSDDVAYAEGESVTVRAKVGTKVGTHAFNSCQASSTIKENGGTIFGFGLTTDLFFLVTEYEKGKGILLDVNSIKYLHAGGLPTRTQIGHVLLNFHSSMDSLFAYHDILEGTDLKSTKVVGRLLVVMYKCIYSMTDIVDVTEQKRGKGVFTSVRSLLGGGKNKKQESQKTKEYVETFEAFYKEITVPIEARASVNEQLLMTAVSMLSDQGGRKVFLTIFRPQAPPQALLPSKFETFGVVLRAALRHANNAQDYEHVIAIYLMGQAYYRASPEGDMFVYSTLREHEAFRSQSYWEDVFFRCFRRCNVEGSDHSAVAADVLVRIVGHQASAGMSSAKTSTFLNSISSAYKVEAKDMAKLQTLLKEQEELYEIMTSASMTIEEEELTISLTPARLEPKLSELSSNDTKENISIVKRVAEWTKYRHRTVHFYHNEDTNETRSTPPPSWTQETHDTKKRVSKVGHTKRIAKPSLLPGEAHVKDISGVSLQVPGQRKPEKCGTLYLTNYRLVYMSMDRAFNSNHEVRLYREFALGCINQLERDKKTLSIYPRDPPERIVQFTFTSDDASSKIEDLYRAIKRGAYPTDIKECFAYKYKGITMGNGWRIYNVKEEFTRQGVLVPDSKWMISDINQDFVYSYTYPAKLIVPVGFDSRNIEGIEVKAEGVKAFRSKGRIPTLVYRHQGDNENGNVIESFLLRSSQPLVGISSSTSKYDERLLKELKIGVVIDARPKRNAVANKARGGGYEDTQNYSTSAHRCSIEFMGIDNIHVVRESMAKLLALVSVPAEDNYFSLLSDTGWLKHVRAILRGADKCAGYMEEGVNLLVHCSDGWDRTPQLTAMTQVLLDPYYRTLEGFAVLVEKEWLSFGHKFKERCGIGSADFKDTERSPVFVQFLDCVWQLTYQFPLAFQFNTLFLEEIVRALHKNFYGTFLHDNERDRAADDVRRCTASIWTSLLQKSKCVNPIYEEYLGRLVPDLQMRSIRLWPMYYQKYPEEMVGENFLQHASEVLWRKQGETNIRVSWLERKLTELEKTSKGEKLNRIRAATQELIEEELPRQSRPQMQRHTSNFVRARTDTSLDPFRHLIQDLGGVEEDELDEGD